MGRSEQAPEVVVELGGEERTLRFDAAVLEDLEDEIGLNLLQLWNELALELDGQAFDDEQAEKEAFEAAFQKRVLKGKTLSGVVWAMLLHQDEKLTRRQVARWLTGRKIVSVPAQALGLLMREFALGNDAEASEGTDPTEPGLTSG